MKPLPSMKHLDTSYCSPLLEEHLGIKLGARRACRTHGCDGQYSSWHDRRFKEFDDGMRPKNLKRVFSHRMPGKQVDKINKAGEIQELGDSGGKNAFHLLSRDDP